MEQKNTLHPLVALGIILALGGIISVLVAGGIFSRIRAQGNTVAVTGSAKMEVVSDRAKWTMQINRTVRQSTLRTGYEQLERDLVIVKDFLTAQGFDVTTATIAPVMMFEQYNQDAQAERIYTLQQTIEIQSENVEQVTKAASATRSVIDRGVLFSTTALEYYYSGLPEARVLLLSDAIKDAQARAGELARSSGKKVGDLVSATSGVVQVQSRNSTDISDYGSYDTSKIEKQITLTVRASFRLR